MTKKNLLLALPVSALMLASSQAAVLVALDESSVQSISNGTSDTGNFNQTITDSNGAMIELKFTFTATGTGSPTLNRATNRLGIDSGDNASSAGSTSVNPGETITLGVEYVGVSGLAGGQTLGSVLFNLDAITLYRSGPNAGSGIDFTWDSSARTSSFTSGTLTTTGAQPTSVTDDSTFDLLTGDYSGTFSVTTTDGTPGLRWGTGDIDIDLASTITAVPEPSSVTLLGLASLGLLTRRRR